ncbi:hypothetical protein [Cognatishimia sp.]|uniref:hypothetical protein n=1 Tax=Cognatishimia sp. TaxID=2211648 RepID=UPI003517C739|nr:hypothetical protein [Cognatishimia sp.]
MNNTTESKSRNVFDAFSMALNGSCKYTDISGILEDAIVNGVSVNLEEMANLLGDPALVKRCLDGSGGAVGHFASALADTLNEGGGAWFWELAEIGGGESGEGGELILVGAARSQKSKSLLAIPGAENGLSADEALRRLGVEIGTIEMLLEEGYVPFDGMKFDTWIKWDNKLIPWPYGSEMAA